MVNPSDIDHVDRSIILELLETAKCMEESGEF